MKKCRKCKGPCIGPCYDLCMCSHCWNGWKQIPFLKRVWERIKYIWLTEGL